MTITFIGAGNVASHLAPAFAHAGHRVVCIFSRTLAAAQDLAAEVGQGSVTTDDIGQLVPADIYILAVTDAAIADIVASWPEKCRSGAVVHTSGSTPMEVLAPVSNQYGVLYPLQTFTKHKQLNTKDITCFVEANCNDTKQLLMQLGNEIFIRTEYLDSAHRRLIHLAAVFACNFSNHMVALGYELLERHHIDPDCLAPLLQETFEKLKTVHPHQGQTGPARRHDENIIREHQQLLSDDSSLQTLYRLISNSIEQRF